jgi:hypothetical protein
MEQLMSMTRVLKIIEFIEQISKFQHIIYFYCVYIDLDSWKNVLPRMYIDLYIVNRTK